MIWFYRFIAFLSHIIPVQKIAFFLTERMADGAYFTFYKNKINIVVANMERALNRELKLYEKRNLVMQNFRNFAKFIYEYIIMPKLSFKNLTKYFSIIHKERLDSALKENKGVIVLTAHLGNWEWGAAMLAILGYSPRVVALTHPSEKVTDFFTKRREAVGMKVTYIGENMRPVISTLKQNGVVATLGDRDYLNSKNYYYYFGEKASFPKGIFKIAYKMGSSVIPSFCVKEKEKYTVYFEKAINFHNIQEGTKKWIEILEKYVKKYITQWYVFDPIWN